MTSADVFEQIEKMGQLPSLPQTLLHVQAVASDVNSSAEDLAVCILKDQSLTMRVLKVVNSAMYQRRSRDEVHTVRKAVIVMGFETVRKLALGLSVFDMMSKLSRSPWLAHIANHSLATAAFAQILAEAAGTIKPEEAFVSALVHDIGKVVLLECSPSAMDAVLADQGGGVDSLEAERRHFGITHDRAGRRLAARWDLPPLIQNVIGDHHDIDPLAPPHNLDPLLGIIVYANAMSRFDGAPANREDETRILRKAARKLSIPSSRLEDLHEQVNRAVTDLADCFGVEIGDLQQYGQLVNVSGGVNVGPRRLSAEELARRTADQLALYQAIGRGLAGAREPKALIGQILQGAVDILGFERVILLDVDRAEHRLTPRAWAGIEAEQLASRLQLPLKRSSGAVALAVLEHRAIHVPDAASAAYGDLVGERLLAEAACTGFAVAPVYNTGTLAAVIYADCGPGGEDVTAEQSSELGGLAVQTGLALGARQPEPAA